MSLDTGKLTGFARLSSGQLSRCASFCDINSTCNLLQVDKRTKGVVEEQLSKINSVDSIGCSRLLTECWNTALGQMSNPRQALRSVTRVAIQQGVILLQSPTSERHGYRYIDPKELETFQTVLKSSSWAEKVKASKRLMGEAVAFPAHFKVTVHVSTIFHGVAVHQCYASKVAILKDEVLHRVHRVFDLQLNETLTEYAFQLVPLSTYAQHIYPTTDAEKQNVKTIKELTDEISASIETAKKKVPALVEEAVKANSDVIEFAGATPFEALVSGALSTYIMEKAYGRKLIRSRLPWSLV